MTWNNKRPGETGKGSRNRSNKLKVSEGMERIQSNKKEWESCGGCKHFRNGFDVLGNTLCEVKSGFNLNNKKVCNEWESN